MTDACRELRGPAQDHIDALAVSPDDAAVVTGARLLATLEGVCGRAAP